jgi:hypothetical protein
MVQPAREVGSAFPAQVASIHRAAEVTSAPSVKMTTARPAAATRCKRIGRNPSASHRHGATMIAIFCNTVLRNSS